MEKEVGEVVWTVFGSNFVWRTVYPGLFMFFLIHFNQLPGHFVDFIQKRRLIIIIFDVVYVL